MYPRDGGWQGFGADIRPSQGSSAVKVVFGPAFGAVLVTLWEDTRLGEGKVLAMREREREREELRR